MNDKKLYFILHTGGLPRSMDMNSNQTNIFFKNSRIPTVIYNMFAILIVIIL